VAGVHCVRAAQKSAANLPLRLAPQAAKERHAQALRRRAGGGGLLGLTRDADDVGDATGDAAGAPQDATDVKIAEALHRRLGGLLDFTIDLDSAAPAAAEAPAAQDDASDDGGDEGIQLFRRGPAVCSVAMKVEAPPAAPQLRPPGGLNKRRQLQGGDDDPAALSTSKLQARCAAAAVDGAAIEAAAAAHKAAAARGVMPVEPTVFDTAGRAKRRRMLREVLQFGASEGVPAAVILAAAGVGG
jgi:hypothetical protein